MGDEPSAEEGEIAGDETLARNVRDMLEYLEEQISSGRDSGVDFTEIESMLAGARIILESGDSAGAIDLINECMQKASKRYSEFEMLIAAIRKAEKEIKTAHEDGKDVSEAGRRLRMSRMHLEKGDYRLGIDTAKLAVEALTESKPQGITWGSGLSGSE